MQILPLVVTYFGCFFTFGFGLAFLVPLMLAMSEPPPAAKTLNLWPFIAGMTILIQFGVPLFWCLKLGVKIWKRWPRALAKWREDLSLHRHFRVFATSASITAIAAAFSLIPS